MLTTISKRCRWFAVSGLLLAGTFLFASRLLFLPQTNGNLSTSVQYFFVPKFTKISATTIKNNKITSKSGGERRTGCFLETLATLTNNEPVFQQDCKSFVSQLKSYTRHVEEQFQSRFRSAGICRIMSIYDKNPLDTLVKGSAKLSDARPDGRCKPRVMMLSLCVEAERHPFCTLTFQRMQSYADHNGYQFRGHYGKLFEDKDSYWQKAFWIHRLLHDQNFTSSYDIIVWLDDDVLIINDDVRLENVFLLGHSNVQLVMSRDIDVYDPNKFANSAVYLLKVTNETALYFKEVILKYDTHKYWRNNRFHEQSAMILTIYENFHGHTLVLPLCFLQCFWNPTIQQWNNGCFTLHVVGTELKERIQLIQFMANLTLDQSNRLLTKHAAADCFNEYPSFYFNIPPNSSSSSSGVVESHSQTVNNVVDSSDDVDDEDDIDFPPSLLNIVQIADV